MSLSNKCIQSIENFFTQTDTRELLGFKRLSASPVYLFVCKVLLALITFLTSHSSRFEPIIEILTEAYHEMVMLKVPADELAAEDKNPGTGFRKVHVKSHTVRGHDVLRECGKRQKASLEEKVGRLEEQNRSLRTEMDSQKAEFQQELEKARSEKKEALERQAAEKDGTIKELRAQKDQLQEELTDMKLEMSSKTSNWSSSMEREIYRSTGEATFQDGRCDDYEDRMLEEEQAGKGSSSGGQGQAEHEENSPDEQESQAGQEKEKPKGGGVPGHPGASGHSIEGAEVKTQRILCYPEEIAPEDRDKYEWTEGEEHEVFEVSMQVEKKVYVPMETRIEGERKDQIALKGKFPQEAKSKTSYGFTLQLLVVFYHIIGMMGMERISQTMRHLFGITMSKSTVKNILSRNGKRMLQARDRIAEWLKEEGRNPDCVLTADETSFKVRGVKFYDHVLAGARCVLHTVSGTRGLAGTYKSGVLEGFMGWLVTDFFSNYIKRPWKKAYDWAHLKRALAGARIRNPQAQWVKMMQEFGYQSYKAYYLAKDEDREIPEDELGYLVGLYDQALKKGFEEEATLKRKTRNLLYRMDTHKEGILAHLYHTNVFLTSNRAERAVRSIKRRMDVSGSFGSVEGAEEYAAFLSVIETAKARGLDPFIALAQVMGGNIDYPLTGVIDESIEMLKAAPVMTTDYSSEKNQPE